MKKIKFLSVLFVAISALTFVSCETEPVDPVLNGGSDNNGENPGNGNGGATASFKVDYNGATRTAISQTAVLGNDLLQIVGVFGSNGEAIAIVLEGTPQTGTYSAEDVLLSYNTDTDAESSYTNIDDEDFNGSLEITSIDTVNKTISGTFSFTGIYGDSDANVPSIEFTNGSFANVPYTVNTEPETPDDNSFVATVDGTAIDYSNDVIGSEIGSGDQDYIVINTFGEYEINIQTALDVTAGTYQFTGSIVNGVPVASFTTPDGTDYDITGGNLTISVNDGDHIVGTFNFDVTDENGEVIHTVTGGSFDIYY